MWLLAALGGGFGIACAAVLIAVLSLSGGGSGNEARDSGLAAKPAGPEAGAGQAGTKPVPRKHAGSKARPVETKAAVEDEDWLDEEENLKPRELLDRAKRYLSEHPGEYDRAIGVLNAVMRRCQDVFNDEIEAEISKITDLREQDAEREFAPKLAAAEADLAAGRIRQAFESMKSFPDRFCGSTSYEKATAFAKQIVAKARALLENEVKKAEELEAAGDFTGAIKAVGKMLELGIEEITSDARFEISRIERRRDLKARDKAAADGEVLFEAFLPGFLERLRRREYSEAERLVRESLAGATNPRYSELLAAELADVPRLTEVFPLADRKLSAFEGRDVTFRIHGKDQTGTIVRLNSSSFAWGLKTATGTSGINTRTLSAADVEAICAKGDLSPSERFSLGLFLLAEMKPVAARKALEASGLITPRLVRRIEGSMRLAVAVEIDEALDEAAGHVSGKDFPKARKSVQSARDRWKDAFSKEQAARAGDIMVECATLESGIRNRLRGKAWILEDGRARIIYRFDADEEILDWKEPMFGEAGVSQGRLEVRKRGVLWTRLKFKAPYEFSMDASGEEICLSVGGRGAGDGKDGVQVVIGREGKAFVFVNGGRSGDWPVKFDRSAGHRVRLLCDTLNMDLTLELDGEKVFTHKPGDDQLVEGRLGFWGPPGEMRIDNLEILGLAELDASDATEVKSTPKKPVRLFTGSLDEGWTKWKGDWKADSGEIHGQGGNVALISTATSEYRFTEYTFQVEVKNIKGEESSPGVVFMFGGRFPIWVFENEQGKILGIPDVTAMGHDLDKRWNVLTIVCRNNKAEGFVGSKRVFSAANPASAGSPWEGCPPGIGLVCARGSAVFRNPTITIHK